MIQEVAWHVAYALKRDLEVRHRGSGCVDVTKGQRLIERPRGNHLAKEILGVSVSKAREIDRSISAFDCVREAGCAAGLSLTDCLPDSLAGLIAIDEPVDSRVSRGSVLTGSKELD